VDEIFGYALKLLRNRDYSVARLKEKVEAKFGSVPEEVIAQLLKKDFLNDQRFAENYVAARRGRGRVAISEDLRAHGLDSASIDRALAQTDWPSLHDAAAAKIKRLNLRAPLQPRDAARLFRALLRLGYEEDAIREEIEHLYEQQ